jgi:signal transduction histidine kinase
MMDQSRKRAAEKLSLLEQLEQQRQLLERAQRVKDQFLGVLSHELRTPLNVVMGYARLLKERMLGELDPIQAEAISKIISHARDQLAMVTDMLAVTSLNAGETALRIQEIPLDGLLEDLKSDHEVPERKNIQMIWDYPENLPIIRTDGDKLAHILRNLIDNAVKFTHRGSVTVSARFLRGPGGGATGKKYLEFRVADTGIGIAPEHLPAIFELFHQVDGSTTRAYGGVGMGLHVVKRLAAILGANLDVESVPGQGSTFTLTLGCDEAPERVVTQKTRQPRQSEERQIQIGA